MTVCSVEGCRWQARTRGWCVMHYTRWHRHGDVGGSEPVRRPFRGCSVDGCEQGHHARGRCHRHYSQLVYRETHLVPPCLSCSAAPACDAHVPPVCVCDAPKQGLVTGQCDRCYRPYWVRSPRLAALLPEVREAWRKFLADEGVYARYVATEEAA